MIGLEGGVGSGGKGGDKEKERKRTRGWRIANRTKKRRHPMPGKRHTKRPDSIRQNRNRGRDTGRGTEQRKAGIRCRGKEERNEYYKLYGTTAERDGWKMTNPTGNQMIWVRIASEITLRHVRLESDNMFVSHYKSIGYKSRKNAMVWSKAASQSRLMSRVWFLRNG